MDCKKALSETDGDVDKAIELLREKGLAKAVKRAGRETSEGRIAMSLAGATASIVELGCETDFVAKNENFEALADKVAAAAAANPDATSPDALGQVAVDGETIADTIGAAVGTIGENIVLKHVGHVKVDGGGATGGYIHLGGKLGVIVGLQTDA